MLRLHRPEHQRPVRGSSLAQARAPAPAPRSGRPAACPSRGLDVVHLRRRHPRLRQRLPDHRLLRRPVGRRQAVARARPGSPPSRGSPPGSGPRRAAHPTAAPAPPPRSPPPRPCRPPPPRSSCTGRPATAPRSRLNSTNVAGVSITVDAARQRQRALAAAQRLAGQVHRHQRRRARRVDRHARALQPQHVRRSVPTRRSCALPVADVRRPAARAPSGERARTPGTSARRTRPSRLPISWSGAIPARSSASQLVSSSSRCCGSMAHRLARRDAEERRVEPIDSSQEPAPPRVILPGASGSGS